MYKCSECGTEFDTKPEYCDCGNDTFEEVIIKPVKTESKSLNQQVSKKQENIREIPKLKPTPKIEPEPEPLKIKKETTTYDYRGLKAFFDPISTIAFLLCITLSIVVAFWGGEKDENTTQISQPNNESEEIVTDIPSIDSYWDNSISVKTPEPAIVEEPVKQEDQSIVQLVEQVFKPQKTEQPKAKPSVAAPKASTTTVNPKVPAQSKPVVTKTQTTKATQSAAPATPSKTGAPSQSITDLTNRVKNSIQYTNQTATSTAGSSVSNAQKQSNTVSPQTKNQPQVQTQTQTQSSKVPAIRTNTSTTANSTSTTQTQTSTPVVKTVDPAVAKQELANYKASLRNTIGRKIDFTRVVGDGDCALSFKVNSSGKLTNRAFTKQSSNVTLNNAVYAAMNSTTSFSAPPSAYNNETLNLTIRFYNGNFEIYLK